MSDTPHIAFVGDSLGLGLGDPTTLGWVGRLAMLSARNGKPFVPYLLGVSGDTSTIIREHFASEVERRLLQHIDSRVVLQMGVEDCRILDEKPVLGLRDSILNLKTMLEVAKPHFKVLLVSPPPVYEPGHNSRVLRLVQGQAELARSLHIPFIDVFKPLNTDVQYKRELAAHDKVHPMQQGYEKIFSIVSNDRQWWFNR